MATVKFAKMSTKKLTTLLETASEEDAVVIKDILASRKAAKADAEAATESAELSEEEKAAIASAEAATESAEASAEKKEKKTGGRKPTEKLTPEELEAAWEKAKEETVSHRCEVTLPGTAIKVPGTVISVLKDKRAMQIYLCVETDVTSELPEAKKMYKKYGSDQITVLPETVELKKASQKTRAGKVKTGSQEWGSEVEAVNTAAAKNVGKLIQLDETTEARIVGLLNDKRSQGLYYKIAFTDETGAKKICHRAVRYEKAETGEIVLAEVQGMSPELDEEGKSINEAYAQRPSRVHTALDPEQKFKNAQELLEKAQKTLEKAKETLVTRQAALEVAKVEYEAWQKAQLGIAPETPAETPEETPAEAPAETGMDPNDDLA